MIFEKHSAAKIQSDKLTYKSPRVVPYSMALEMESENEANFNPDDTLHPFDPEALGQE
jgi:hypothetical protein